MIPALKPYNHLQSQTTKRFPVTTNKKKYWDVEGEFLLVLVKIRLGLSIIVLEVRLNIYEATVSKLFTIWINNVRTLR